MFPWKEPTPIVREATEYRRTRTEKKSLRQKLLSKNNRVSADGRINIKQEGDFTWAITISPNRLLADYKVMEQNIEPKLRGLVRSLVKKRYYTLSSCQSHGSDYNCYVTCAIYSTNLVVRLQRIFKGLGWLYSDIRIMKPEEYINSSYDEKTDAMVHLKPTHDQALEAVNNILNMQLDSIHIVQIIIRRGSKSIIEDIMFWLLDKWLLDRRIRVLTEMVDCLPSENFLKELHENV